MTFFRYIWSSFYLLQIQEFGVTEIRDLKPNGRNVRVTEENKKEYVKLVCQMKMTGAIQKQLQSFLDGFYSVIPKRLISIFNEQELELLISGLPTFDIDDLRTNTEYHKYQATSLQVHSWYMCHSFAIMIIESHWLAAWHMLVDIGADSIRTMGWLGVIANTAKTHRYLILASFLCSSRMSPILLLALTLIQVN